ncbi:protein of unknown function [Bradyrhizobium vignae]|uniref:Uncharacterized protein n=1 Tax=Bradyrhizobium vignae TaxID=1549949 RepID=A0A2U3PQH2_9BRAD|nr:protein of unknown function [Bradyrhizobium vignae]
MRGGRPTLRQLRAGEAIQNPSAEAVWICFVARAPRNGEIEARRLTQTRICQIGQWCLD